MPHTASWFEISLKDMERVIAFYSAILDCQLKKDEHGGVSFAVFPHEEYDVGGCLILDKNISPSEHGVLVYLNVTGKMNDSLAQVEKMGGKIIENKKIIGPWGSRAIIFDTEGNKLALHSA